METIYTTHIGTNTDLFPKILKLYLKEGSSIADVTYGKGIFWKKVDKDRYRLLATDAQTGIDFRNLPYDS